MGEKADTARERDGARRAAGRCGAERARAAAYLDLWERHVVALALQGPALPDHGGDGGTAPKHWPG